MAIPVGEWKTAVRGVVQRIADERYQRVAWFGQHEESSSPAELICQLYDDFCVEDFINDTKVGLSPTQRQAASRLLAKLSQFCNETSSVLNPQATIDDPRWVEIRGKAEELLRALPT